MKTKHVVVLPYDHKWKSDFETIKKELEAAIGDISLSIEHIGSTSVEGLSAKPIIDIDVVIESREIFDEVTSRLEKAGYIHEGDLGIEGREAFDYSGKEHLMKHHLYVCPKNSKELHRHMTFRNFLRSDQDAMKRYSEVKIRGAELFPDDIDKYIEYKSECIKEFYKKCGLE
ncbi:MAG: GrpB family protein [Ruminococcaceae bacterium]|nr:GrpB family protein [Oscillospiraceae bacterium]